MRDVARYDVMVIGSGSGAEIADSALQQGLSVAYVDRGPLGGTCANVGCIPTKMIIFPADMIMEMREAQRLGVAGELRSVDFQGIMRRTRHHVEHERLQMEASLRRPPENLGFFPAEGHFVGSYTLEVAGRRIRADKIFIVAGARPCVPPIDGIEQVGYLDNASALQLDDLPPSITIIGGGYIACEFAHFFSAMGSDVTIVQRNRYLVPNEDREVSELLAAKLGERMRVVTGAEAVAARLEGDERVVVARDVRTGHEQEFRSAAILLAAGRVSNADLLQVTNTGVEVDERGYIKVDEYLRTNVANIWAFGDVIGKEMFKHVANREALFAWHNSLHDHLAEFDYRAAPHAVFTWPQVAAVGLTEEEAKAQYGDILVGKAHYTDVAKGIAMMEPDSFAKAIVDPESGRILGFHIIGRYAPILIQEVVQAMATGAGIDAISAGMHIHPALSEVVLRALAHLHPA